MLLKRSMGEILPAGRICEVLSVTQVSSNQLPCSCIKYPVQQSTAMFSFKLYLYCDILDMPIYFLFFIIKF